MKSCKHEHAPIIHNEALCPLCAALARLSAVHDVLLRYGSLWTSLQETAERITHCQRELAVFRGTVEVAPDDEGKEPVPSSPTPEPQREERLPVRTSSAGRRRGEMF